MQQPKMEFIRHTEIMVPMLIMLTNDPKQRPVFGFFDKVVSSFASTLVGWCCVMIGFADRFPSQEDPLTSGLFWATLFLFIGIPILGWVCSLVAMKFYPLDQDKMIEVQAKIAGMKQENAAQK